MTDKTPPTLLQNLSDSQKKLGVLAIAGIIILGATGSLAYWLFIGRTQVPKNMQLGANVVPQNSLMTISLSTNERQWENLRSFGTANTQAAFDQSLVQLRDQFQIQTKLDYLKDIQPWVGQEVTWAYLAPEIAEEETQSEEERVVMLQEPSWVMIVPIANPLKAKEISGKLVNQELTKRTYKDIEIQETPPDAEVVFSSTVLEGRYLVISSAPEATDRVIDTFKGKASVASTPGYKNALEQLGSSSALARVYVNIPEATRVAAANSVRPIAPEELEKMETNQGLAATVEVVSNGLLFKGITWLSNQADQKLTTDSLGLDLGTYMPSDTLFMLTGSNFNQVWNQYTTGVEGNPLAPLNPQGLKQGLLDTTGLNLEEDLLKWMDGEFAIAMIPANQAGSPIPFGFAVMVNTGDRETADQTFTTLDGVMKDKYQMQINSETVGETEITQWQLPFGIVDISRAWLSDDLVMMTFGAAIANRLITPPETPLASSEAFKTSIPTGLSPQSGYFYADMERLFNQNLPLPIIMPPNQDNLFKAFDSIGLTSAITSPRTTRYDLLVRLKKGQTPGPLPSPSLNPSPTPEPSPEASPESSEESPE
ncbi:DUF3352 domain-containing protein [Roseofilum sp. BLCC_M154]|uniref:DUF3352 domain-containing protein n=1 Tax=Roseofilum acuticapitatum BLCC-M154 TaxID=3022444 RepID=A0ABT7AME4_9CYAN|nr:DUF3352 domain-containing protein [Roseofilum acuticapitatum]MDJ1168050.1 DUF3352 domain-containing protein [Roseofilum acuticapitatum BLCC-M154]